MPRSRKINLEKVQAPLDAVCPKCAKVIPPADVRRVDFERYRVPGVRGAICAGRGFNRVLKRNGLITEVTR